MPFYTDIKLKHFFFLKAILIQLYYFDFILFNFDRCKNGLYTHKYVFHNKNNFICFPNL